MGVRLFAMAFLFAAAACSQTKGPRTFDLELPAGWRDAGTLVVVFHDLEIPENRPVVFRLFAPGEGEERNLGSLGVPGTSPEAQGTRRLERAEVNITSAFRRWAEAAKPGARVAIRVEPFAGLREARDYPWRVESVSLEAR
jgi:hypothetical protein